MLRNRPRRDPFHNHTFARLQGKCPYSSSLHCRCTGTIGYTCTATQRPSRQAPQAPHVPSADVRESPGTFFPLLERVLGMENAPGCWVVLKRISSWVVLKRIFKRCFFRPEYTTRQNITTKRRTREGNRAIPMGRALYRTLYNQPHMQRGTLEDQGGRRE